MGHRFMCPWSPITPVQGWPPTFLKDALDSGDDHVGSEWGAQSYTAAPRSQESSEVLG